MNKQMIFRWAAVCSLLGLALFGRDALAWKRLNLAWVPTSPLPGCAPPIFDMTGAAVGYTGSAGNWVRESGCMRIYLPVLGDTGTTVSTTNGQCVTSTAIQGEVLAYIGGQPATPAVGPIVPTDWQLPVGNKFSGADWKCADGQTRIAVAAAYGDTGQ